MKVMHKDLGVVLLPDFLLVGAAKSATSSLHYYLDQHPEICMPVIKESWFFSFVDNPPKYSSPGVLSDVASSLKDYIKLFEHANPEQILGDASPSYLYTYEDTIRNIKSIYPAENLDKIRIIISLREPVSRAFSQYHTFRRKVQEPLPFEETIKQDTINQRMRDNWNIFYDYTGFGLYYKQVKAFIDAFGEERVLVLLYDDIRNDQVAACQKIYKFLDVNSDYVPDVAIKHNSLTGEPRARWLMRIVTSRNNIKRAIAAFIPKIIRNIILYFVVKLLLKRARLAEERKNVLMKPYKEDIKKLEELIHRDLSHWREAREGAPSNQQS